MALENNKVINSIDRLNKNSRGSLEEISDMLGTNEKYVKQILDKLPKSVEQLDEISKESDFTTYKLWKKVCEKSFDYMLSIAEFYKAALEDDYGSPEFKKLEIKSKDEARRYSHEALISSINPWMRSLVKNNIDINFLQKVVNKNDRVSYGDFGLGIALQLFISE